MFSLINSIIDRLGESMKPFAAGFMHLLPQAWEAADGHSLLRMQILISLQKLVHALGLDSWTCYPLLASLLPFCTDINQVGHSCMLVCMHNVEPPALLLNCQGRMSSSNAHSFCFLKQHRALHCSCGRGSVVMGMSTGIYWCYHSTLCMSDVAI